MSYKRIFPFRQPRASVFSDSHSSASISDSSLSGTVVSQGPEFSRVNNIMLLEALTAICSVAAAGMLFNEGEREKDRGRVAEPHIVRQPRGVYISPRNGPS